MIGDGLQDYVPESVPEVDSDEQLARVHVHVSMKQRAALIAASISLETPNLSWDGASRVVLTTRA